MRYTNKYRIPESIASAIIKIQGDYSNEGSDISASSITVDPKQYWLTKRHKDKLVVDVRDLYRSFIGTAAHSACEGVAKEDENLIVEVRYSTEILGWKVSSKIDRYDKKRKKLTDLKFSSVYSLTSPPKEEYIAQMGTQRYLMSLSGIEVDEMELDISAVDWYEARSIQPDYPNSPSKSIKVEIWPLEKTRAFLEDRVSFLQSYKDVHDDEIPPCTEKSRWYTGDVWAVYKDTKAKRATKLHDTEMDAKVHSAKIGGRVEFRPGVDKKCIEYCQCRDFCTYYKDKYGGKDE